MRLFLNGKQADLFEDTEITSQLNSPFTDFKIVGDKSYSYTLPASERNCAIAGYSNLRQAANLPEEIISSLQDSNIEIIRGKARLKRVSDQALTLDCVVPPGNIPAGFWNKKLRELDLGVDNLPTTHVVSDIYVLKYTDKGYSTSNAADLREFGAILSTISTTIRIKLASMQLIEYTFSGFGQLSENYKETAVAEFQNELAEYNKNPLIVDSEIYLVDGTLNIIGDFRLGDLKLKPTVEITFFQDRGAPGETIVFNQLKRLEYEDIGYDLKLARLQNKNYFFPTISAPKYYNEKNSDYNGFLNYKESGELKLNDAYNRTTFPLCPAFRFRFVFEQLMILIGYDMYVDFWDEWEDLSFCAFRDMAMQHPDTKLPFNVYPSQIRYADYMPDWTVAEFFNEFGLLTCSSFDFQISEKTFRIEALNKLFASTPVVFEGKSRIVEQNFEDAKTYQLGYSQKIDSELETDALKAFFQDYPTEAENRTKLALKFLPLAPITEQAILINQPTPRKNGGWQGGGVIPPNVEKYEIMCHSVAQSLLFDLTGETPIARVFFYDAENRKALIETTIRSLSMNSHKGLNALWENIIEARKGKILTIETDIPVIVYSKLRFLVPFQYKNVNYLIRQVTIKIRNKRTFHRVQLQLEQIS